MNCFNHNNVVAISICKVCGKGICCDCVHEQPLGVTCSESCRLELDEISEINDRAKMLYGIGKHKKVAKISMPVLTILVTGLFFLVYGLYDLYSESYGIGSFIAIIGAIFVVGSVLDIYRRAKFGLRL